jgi:predicted phage terminase large subunit-like protein
MLQEREQWMTEGDWKEEFLASANRSLIHFALAFFPDAFTDPFCPPIHYEMVRVIDAKGYRQKAVAAPRGVGKSTLGNTVNILRRSLMGYNRYILIVSNTLEQAISHLRAIKKQLQENPMILGIFGDQRGERWREEEIVLKNGCRIRALGSGQQVRGQREGFDRPDYVVIDDFESDQSVTSETTLDTLTNWWASDLRNSLNRHTGEELMLGTVLSDKAILTSQLDNPACLSVRLELFDANYKSAWPEVYPDERIAEMKAQAERQGTLDRLWADMRNVATAAENAKFRREWFKNWVDVAPGSNMGPAGVWEMPRFIIIDPARTMQKTSDYSAVCVVALPYWGEVYLLDFECDRKVNDALYVQIVDLAKRWKINEIYVETNGINDYITDPLEKFLIRNGVIASVTGVHATAAKEDRIMGLIPLYKMGQVYHPPGKEGLIEDQLLQFPRSKYDDLMDCFAYVNKIQTDRGIGRAPLVKGGVYYGNDEELREPAV